MAGFWLFRVFLRREEILSAGRGRGLVIYPNDGVLSFFQTCFFSPLFQFLSVSPPASPVWSVFSNVCFCSVAPKSGEIDCPFVLPQN